MDVATSQNRRQQAPSPASTDGSFVNFGG